MGYRLPATLGESRMDRRYAPHDTAIDVRCRAVPTESCQLRPLMLDKCCRPSLTGSARKSKHGPAVATEFDSGLSPPYACCRSGRFPDRSSNSVYGDHIPRVLGSVGTERPIGRERRSSACDVRGCLFCGEHVCTLRSALGSFGLW